MAVIGRRAVTVFIGRFSSRPSDTCPAIRENVWMVAGLSARHNVGARKATARTLLALARRNVNHGQDARIPNFGAATVVPRDIQLLTAGINRGAKGAFQGATEFL